MGSILDDYIEGRFTRYSNKQIKNNKTGRSHVNETSQYRADIAIKACPDCKRTWEKAINSKSIIRHPRGTIPTYGKKKVKCPIC